MKFFERNKDNKKNKPSDILKKIIIIVFALAVLFICIIIFGKLTEYFILDDEFIYYKIGFIGSAAFMIVATECTLILIAFFCLIKKSFHYFIKNFHESKNQSFIEKQINEEKKPLVKLKETISGIVTFLLIFTFINGLLVYCYFSDITVVAENRITNRTPLTPFGHTYHFSDVTEYEVYEKDENPALELVMNDNRKIKIGGYYCIEGTRDDGYGYQYLCDIDDILKSNNVLKK